MCDCQSTYLSFVVILEPFVIILEPFVVILEPFVIILEPFVVILGPFVVILEGSPRMVLLFIFLVISNGQVKSPCCMNFWGTQLRQLCSAYCLLVVCLSQRNNRMAIHLSQKNHTIKSISWVEPGQLGKIYDFRFTYFKISIYFRVMFNTMFFHSPQLFITNVQIRRENYNIKSISWVWSRAIIGQKCDCQSTYFKRTKLSSRFLGLKQGN